MRHWVFQVDGEDPPVLALETATGWIEVKVPAKIGSSWEHEAVLLVAFTQTLVGHAPSLAGYGWDGALLWLRSRDEAPVPLAPGEDLYWARSGAGELRACVGHRYAACVDPVRGTFGDVGDTW